jgi:hypothetical protein
MGVRDTLECGGLTPLSFLLWFGQKKQKKEGKGKKERKKERKKAASNRRTPR